MLLVLLGLFGISAGSLIAVCANRQSDKRIQEIRESGERFAKDCKSFRKQWTGK